MVEHILAQKAIVLIDSRFFAFKGTRTSAINRIV